MVLFTLQLKFSYKLLIVFPKKTFRVTLRFYFVNHKKAIFKSRNVIQKHYTVILRSSKITYSRLNYKNVHLKCSTCQVSCKGSRFDPCGAKNFSKINYLLISHFMLVSLC